MRDSVDCIAFWTKDPRPLLALRSRLERAVPCPYFVQFTLNAYGADVEAGLPRKARLVEVFQELAHVLGPERVVWRYSPILLGGSYDVEHHLRYFETFARTLEGSTRRCRLSFLDVYRKIAPRMEALGLSGVPDAEKRALAQRLAEIAAGFGIEVGGCGDPALDEAGLAGEGLHRRRRTSSRWRVSWRLAGGAHGGRAPAAVRRAWTWVPTTRARTAVSTATRTPARTEARLGGFRGTTQKPRCSATRCARGTRWRSAPCIFCQRRRRGCSRGTPLPTFADARHAAGRPPCVRSVPLPAFAAAGVVSFFRQRPCEERSNHDRHHHAFRRGLQGRRVLRHRVRGSHHRHQLPARLRRRHPQHRGWPQPGVRGRAAAGAHRGLGRVGTAGLRAGGPTP